MSFGGLRVKHGKRDNAEFDGDKKVRDGPTWAKRMS